MRCETNDDDDDVIEDANFVSFVFFRDDIISWQ